MSTIPQPVSPTIQTQSSQKLAPRRRHPKGPKSQPQASTEPNSLRAGKEKSARSANPPVQLLGGMHTDVATLSVPIPSSTVQLQEVIPKPKKNRRKISAVAEGPTSSNNQQIPSSMPGIPPANISAPSSVQQMSAEGSSKPVPTSENTKVKKPLVPLALKDKDANKAAKGEQRPKKAKKKSKEDKEKKKDDHFHLVLAAAEATIAALRTHGLSCAVFGSLACKLYGNFRFPKDADLLVLQPPPPDPDTPLRTAEEIKALILDTDPRHFYLKLPRDPTAPYRILRYRQEYLGADCKVDILTPGIMNLPNIPIPSFPLAGILAHDSILSVDTHSPASMFVSSEASPVPPATNPNPPSLRNHITTISAIPLVPFSLLLLHKLQGWADHRIAPEEHKRRKHPQDAADVRRLLAMEEMMKELQQSQPWSDMELFSEEFQELTRTRVKDYCQEFPTRAEPWESLGFEIL